MKPKEYALALYKALRGKNKTEVDAGVKRFAAALKKRGAIRLLPRILAALPAAAHVADADKRVTVHSATALDDKALHSAVKALGLDAGETEVVNKVDEDLIGGAKIVSVRGTLDGTVKGKLARLKTALSRSA
jgi:F-type H+-transporting ATPase subunit delta